MEAERAGHLIVIGSGVGGYSAAIRAAQLGLKVTLVERAATLGGTCLNVGCIPSKALLESSERFEATRTELAEHGIAVDGVRLDLAAMLARKRAIVDQLTAGVAELLKRNRVRVVRGTARFEAPGSLLVAGVDGDERLTAENFVIATGSAPVNLPSLPFDGEGVVSSTEALSFAEVPRHLAVVGAGAIGLDLGSVWRRLGAKVTVIEMEPNILPHTDRQMARQLARVLKAQGMELVLSARVLGVQRRGGELQLAYEAKDGKTTTLECDRVLVAVGRRPYTEALGLDRVGIATTARGFIPVDERLQTTVPGVYAVGDVIEGPLLAHKAHEDGVAAAEIIAGHAARRPDLVPNVVYTEPELASIGHTEETLKAEGVRFKTGRFLFRANGRALSAGHTDGLVKVLADAETDTLLGVHIVGPHASELIGEAVVAMHLGATATTLADTIHAHPTLSEALKEAALDVHNRAIHGG